MFKANTLVTADIRSVRRRTPIYEAMRLPAGKNIRGLPVVNDDVTLSRRW